jgi:hypothetical protein
MSAATYCCKHFKVSKSILVQFNSDESMIAEFEVENMRYNHYNFPVCRPAALGDERRMVDNAGIKATRGGKRYTPLRALPRCKSVGGQETLEAKAQSVLSRGKAILSFPHSSCQVAVEKKVYRWIVLEQVLLLALLLQRRRISHVSLGGKIRTSPWRCMASCFNSDGSICCV